MRLVTFINIAYVDMCHNLYCQLKRFNRHENLTIICSDQETHNELIRRNLECEIKTYTPLLFNKYIETITPHLINKEYGSTINQSYTIYQFLKHDAFYQTLLFNDDVCLIDSDMIILDDFIDELSFWINNDRRFHVSDEPTQFAFKYYLQIKICVNVNDTINLYHWMGREQIINGGLMYARRCDTTLNHIKNYCDRFVPHFNQINNIDEMVVSDYFKTQMLNTYAITDYINLINNVGVNYTPEQVLRIRPLTFHPTFEGDKTQFIKDCNHWFVE